MSLLVRTRQKSSMNVSLVLRLLCLVIVFLLFYLSLESFYAASAAASSVSSEQQTVISSLPWWAWPLILFVVTFFLGIVAVLGGVGGGVLYVPIVGGFLPFHLDFVRGAGLLVALAGALAAGPGLLQKGLADIRLALPVALIASISAIAGALIGLALPTRIIQIALGVSILGIVVIMLMAKKSEFPEVKKADALSTALKIHGVYHEISTGHSVNWKIHHTTEGLLLFILIGIMAGMFGLGAGWANVPVLNLLMGAPLKVAVSTSKFLLSITDASAAWIYINSGAVLPLMVVPSILGIMLGSMLGVRILARTKPASIRMIVIGLLLFAGSRALLKGLEIWN